VSRSYLVDKIDDTGCCDRLFGQVVVTGYSYIQVWCMVDALVHGTGLGIGWCMVDALVYGTG
jgi:hypothetical protein